MIAVPLERGKVTSHAKNLGSSLYEAEKVLSPSHTDIGAIYCTIVFHLTIKVTPPKRATKTVRQKKESLQKAKLRVKSGRYHHWRAKFKNQLLDIIDMDQSLTGSYLVMDDCTIHESHPHPLMRKSKSRGYRVLYLPPYSPGLNPIRQFWFLVKEKWSVIDQRTKRTYRKKIQMHVKKHASAFFRDSVDILSAGSSTAVINQF